jgi:hypothetical protein
MGTVDVATRKRTRARTLQLRGYVVACLEYETPAVGTRAEAEAWLASIIDCGACREAHTIEERWYSAGMAPPAVRDAYTARLAQLAGGAGGGAGGAA